jgi:prolyl 4-hydroxylase
VFLSWSPRIILAHKFLTANEAKHIIQLASKQMQRSSVVTQDGQSGIDDIRTSSGTFLKHNTSDVLDDVLLRVAELVRIPLSHQEAMQVLHYGLNEKYGSHEDTFYLSDMIQRERGLQRLVTCMLYLNTPEKGGETVFPNMPPHGDQSRFSPCAQEGLAHKPETGDILCFWNLDADGTVNHGSMHGGCPVLKGEKWSAPIWIHQSPFLPEHPSVLLECLDDHESCASWTQQGECTKNAEYMTQACRKSCGVCDVAPAGPGSL